MTVDPRSRITGRALTVWAAAVLVYLAAITGRTSRPVISEMSSRTMMFAGSTIATSTARSSIILIGSAS